MIRKEQYVLLTGSDLGNRESNLEMAKNQIAKKIGDILRASEVIESEPWGFESETKFLNQAILIETCLEPLSILGEILKIEELIGRERSSEQWISRLIDVDILCAGDRVFYTSELTIPHKWLHKRPFALEPLSQVVSWSHPLLKKGYSDILSELVKKQPLNNVGSD